MNDVTWAEDNFFLLEVEWLTADVSGMSDLERRVMGTPRWWSLDELDRTDAVVFPLGLGDLVRCLAGNGLPEEPIRLPWH